MPRLAPVAPPIRTTSRMLWLSIETASKEIATADPKGKVVQNHAGDHAADCTRGLELRPQRPRQIGAAVSWPILGRPGIADCFLKTSDHFLPESLVSRDQVLVDNLAPHPLEMAGRHFQWSCS